MSAVSRHQHHVAHLTSAHPRYDTRIYRKLCQSIVGAGYRTTIVVADGKGEETCPLGIRILDVGRPTGRFNRMLRATRRVKECALSLDADIYHLHDPELIPAGLALKRRGRRVIFDFHEDVPKQLLSKPYLDRRVARFVSGAFALYESYAVPRFDAVVGATPAITEKFRDKARKLANINNFPQLGELESPLSWEAKANEVAYVGAISGIRGIVPVVQALGTTKSGAKLNLAGAFSDKVAEKQVGELPGWQRVVAAGVVDRHGVRDILARSVAGIVTFLPLPNHVDAQPNKMFEYMSAGIPVIASDFPLWREIIAGHDCGLCVDPLDPAAIAAAIDSLVSDRARAEEMGRNGSRAVREIFNWTKEEGKLLQLYSDLLA